MTYETIIYRKASGMATITMNRPQAMNAITPDMLGELKTAVLEAGQDQDVKIIVLTGAGKAFCAGVDLKSLGNRKLINGKVGDILDIPARELIQAICSVPKVVIALVNGFCFTGALEIILGCDIVIASEDAKIGDTHAKWSLRPTWGMSARLPRRVGFLKAKELSFTAESISAREAERIGLVNMAVPADGLLTALETMAKKILSNSEQSIVAYKHLYNTNVSLTLEKSLELEFGSEFVISDTEERLAQFRK
ncbi:MAG: enoyl-CoA hydratase/isomerase family protein [Deltaproteobacteria bacterium HGW-Deltaproteobacteria-12]|jgi:enoyl-CoA hydratase/carnithine racemase|nr:MAG: enoyl-CoA hydratase/isomerase family protein [Deltaproteobacteria bacterium HGW-Deltaproteobacteria-12]